MKRLALAAILILAFSFSAFGAVQDFGRFTLNVLDGWTAQHQEPNVVVTKNDNMAQLVITVASTGGASLEDVAKAIAADLSGSGFKDITTPAADSDGDYSFNAVNPNGANTHVLVTGADGEFCAFTTTIAQGAEAAGAEIKTMLDTLAVK